MLMTNKTYDTLKFIALIILPVSEFIAALSNIWGWSHGSAICATLVALDAFLGAVVKISADAYKNCSGENDGERS